MHKSRLLILIESAIELVELLFVIYLMSIDSHTILRFTV